ncbi:MAG: MBL fold metallo-hydrolase [Deltaproteobacteria bacterium]|nr:MBL fold metallo-hydrolase [Deltaproteobacteria bacterium]
MVDTSGHADVMARLRHEPVKPVMNFEKGLQNFGLDLRDIRIVIHTHLMYDDCANSKSLPKAEFVVQKKEVKFAFDPHPMFDGSYQRDLFEGLSFQVIDGDQELLPGIKLLLTPGHSPGGQSVAVSTSAGVAIITGFFCTSDNFLPQKNQASMTDVTPEVIPPGIHTDMLKAYESTLRIRNLADIIVLFHDPYMSTKKQIPDEKGC